MMRQALGVLLLSVALAACAPTETTPVRDTAADLAAIEAGNAAWATAFNAGDLDALGAVYATDAVLYPPGSPPVTGRSAIVQAFSPMIQAGLSGALAPEETRVSGEMGYQIGSFALATAAGDAVDAGHFVEIWGLEDGRWVLTRDIFNSDLPQEEATAEPGDEAAE